MATLRCDGWGSAFETKHLVELGIEIAPEHFLSSPNSIFNLIYVFVLFYFKYLYSVFCNRSLGALQAPTSSWGPYGPLELRPSRLSGAQAGTSGPPRVRPSENKAFFWKGGIV